MTKLIKSSVLSICIMIACILSGCSQSSATSDTTDTSTNNVALAVSYDEDDNNEDYRSETQETITLSSSGITYSGTKANVSGNTITITSAGTYVVSGTASDAQIIVEASNDDLVRIVLDNANITCTTSSPIYVKQAKKVLLTLASDTTNTVSDTSNYTFASGEDEPDATIFSKDDLTINGSGTLIVNANYKTGIKGKDDLKIMNGTIQVTAVDNGILGKDILAIHNGNITITAGGDGLKSNNDTESDKGILEVDAGTININAQQDGMQSDNVLYIYGGDIHITTAGGSENATTKTSDDFGGFGGGGKGNMTRPENTTQNNAQATATSTNAVTYTQTDTTTEEISIKGIKAENSLIVYDGYLTLNCNGNGLHTNKTMNIQGGNIDIATGNKGLHADSEIIIDNGDINVSTCYEGIESSSITINDGTIHIIASDDGVNAATKTTTDTASNTAMPGGGGDSSQLTMNGGYLYVDASGDGIDSNGTITMHSGTMIINGPTSGADGALDFDSSFTIDGGTLIASGASSMLQTPTDISNGNCICIGAEISANTIVHIQDSEGNGIITFCPNKASQSIIIYSDNFSTNTTYQMYTGGSASNNNGDGLYDSATYQDGTLSQEFTISSTLTSVGNASQGMNGGMGNQGGGRGEKPTDMQMPDGEMPEGMSEGQAPNMK